MAVLNIRVDDEVRDVLKDMADHEGVSLSEYVRDLLMTATVPIRPDLESERSEEPAPETMNLYQRQVLSILHRILARVLPEDGTDVDGDPEYQIKRAQILEEGFTGEYYYETLGFRTELSKRDCARVSDILQMFRILTFSIEHLAQSGEAVDEEVARDLEFAGFDYNDALEGHMGSYVEFIMRDGRKWSELRPQIERNDDGNSHVPMLDTYMRMLTEYRRIVDSRERGHGRFEYLLSADELALIRGAQTPPARRR